MDDRSRDTASRNVLPRLHGATLRSTVAAFLLLFTVVGYAYRHHFDNPFVFDDMHTIVNNTGIRSLANIPEFFRSKELSSTLPPNRAYRPIITTSLAIDYAVAGADNPVPFHISMFVAFLFEGVLIFLLARKMFFSLHLSSPLRGFENVGALLATSIFALHTVNAETLNYISARSDLYSTIFVLLALNALMRDGMANSVIAGIFSFLAFITKEQTLVLPALGFMLLYPSTTGEPSLSRLKQTSRRVLPLAIGTVAALVLYLSLQGSAPQSAHTVLSYATTQLWVVTRYFMAFLLPIDLSADADLVAFQNPLDLRAQVGALFLLSLLELARRAFKYQAWVPVGWGIGWFFLSLGVTSSFIPIDDVMNDHRMHFPFVGLSIAAGWMITMLISAGGAIRRAAAAMILLSYTVGHVIGVESRCEVWGSDEALWYDVTVKSPRNGRGLMNYGVAQLRVGKYSRAREYFLKAAAAWPGYGVIYTNLGIVEGLLGDRIAAEANYKRAITLRPNDPSVHFFYARWLYDERRIPEAKRELETTLMLSPTHSDAIQLISSILLPETSLNSGESTHSQ